MLCTAVQCVKRVGLLCCVQLFTVCILCKAIDSVLRQ